MEKIEKMTDKPMTVGQIKKIMKDVPDDTKISVQICVGSYYIYPDVVDCFSPTAHDNDFTIIPRTRPIFGTKID